MAYEDSMLRRNIMHEMAKHQLSTDRVDIHVSRGIVYLSGIVVQQKYANAVDARAEVERIMRIFRGKPGVKDIVNEIRFMQP